MVDVESLVPANHRLRQIDAALDLSFVREAVAACYTLRRGRPSIDPELAVRMMILGVLYDLSDRQLCDEIRMHAGFRWFCRLNFHDPIPDHSTLSRLRNERWAESELFTRLFEQVLQNCVQAGMISGRHVSADGTQIRANASIQSLEVRRSDREDDDVTPENDPPEDPPTDVAIETGNSARSREPQPEHAWEGRGERYSNETHVSRTDPDARLYRKTAGKGAHLSYLVHDLIDTKSRVILGRRASLATGRAERDIALELLDEHEQRRAWLGLEQSVEVLSADAGYGVSEFVADVFDRGITAHVPLLSGDELEEIPTWQRRTFSLSRHRSRYEKVRQARARNRVRRLQGSHGYTVSRKLRLRSEHVFAEAKNHHGMGRARHRGCRRVDLQSLLVATVQNLKRLGHTLWRRAQSATGDMGSFDAFLHVILLLWAPLNRIRAITHGQRVQSQIRLSIQLRLNIPAQNALCSTRF
jgi:transposase